MLSAPCLASPPLPLRYPLRWPSATLALTTGDAFEHQNRFFDGFPFGAEFGEHFEDIHRLIISSSEARNAELRISVPWLFRFP